MAGTDGAFTVDASPLTLTGPNVTATATDPSGATSGFSAPVRSLTGRRAATCQS